MDCHTENELSVLLCEPAPHPRPADASSTPIVLQNGYLSAMFSGTTGALLSVTSLQDGVSTAVNQSFGVYTDLGNAYAFQPTTNDPTPVDASNVTFTVVRGPVVSAVYQRFGPTLVQAARLWNCTHCAFVETEIVVGPLDENVGRCMGWVRPRRLHATAVFLLCAVTYQWHPTFHAMFGLGSHHVPPGGASLYLPLPPSRLHVRRVSQRS